MGETDEKGTISDKPKSGRADTAKIITTMAIKDYKINGKIPDDRVQYVVSLVELDINSLWGSFTQGVNYKRGQENLKKKTEKMVHETGELLDLYQSFGSMVSILEGIYVKNAQDLHEFFYQETGFDENGYYACQFPIDWTKFKKKRVAEKLIKKALKDIDKEKMVPYMKENFKTFLGCLKMKVKWKESF
ncbi:hypothetical protein HOC76_00620 [bacterium]|nr:hypothetical protein [bacterium]MBT6756564.1 hypothetical protein [Candidatus Paceibacterota bacterium]MBT7706600.1 hypothetical protein [archaeon]